MTRYLQQNDTPAINIVLIEQLDAALKQNLPGTTRRGQGSCYVSWQNPKFDLSVTLTPHMTVVRYRGNITLNAPTQNNRPDLTVTQVMAALGFHPVASPSAEHHIIPPHHQ